MTTKINNISQTTFTNIPVGTTLEISNNTPLASTTSFVQSYFNNSINNLISIISPPSIVANLTFANVKTTLLASASNLIIKGQNISIGKSGEVLNIMGNNVPINNNFRTAVAIKNPNSRIQAGIITVTRTGDLIDTGGDTSRIQVNFAVPFTSVPVVIISTSRIVTTNLAVADNGCGVDSESNSGFVIRGRIRFLIHWIAFGN